MFVPPYNLILKHLGPGRSDGRPNDDLTVPRKFLEFILRRLLEHAEFDEKQYLMCNPDVAIAIRRNDMKSAKEHYIQVGYFEGRAGGIPVQEDWYLARILMSPPPRAQGKSSLRRCNIASRAQLNGASQAQSPRKMLMRGKTYWNGNRPFGGVRGWPPRPGPRAFATICLLSYLAHSPRLPLRKGPSNGH